MFIINESDFSVIWLSLRLRMQSEQDSRFQSNTEQSVNLGTSCALLLTQQISKGLKAARTFS